jgi:glycosyltransferase involved in cell wall biosynthesis
MRQRESSLNFYYFISVVIPAYNQQETIVEDVKQIEGTLQTLGYKHEIIIVNDGSTDNTYKQALSIKSAQIKVVTYPKNQGKGHAIRYGMMQAKGDIIGYIDAGMDIHPKGFAMLLNHMDWYNADVIVGSKMHPVSIVQYPLWRKILSWGYRFLTRKMFGFRISDTQVGLKFFKRKVVQDVLPRLVVKEFAFDIEMLAVAYKLGYKRIFEAPIEINFKENSITKFRIWNVIYKMLWDTFAVFYRLKVLHYYDTLKRNKNDLDLLHLQPLYQKK